MVGREAAFRAGVGVGGVPEVENQRRAVAPGLTLWNVGSCEESSTEDWEKVPVSKKKPGRVPPGGKQINILRRVSPRGGAR